MGIKFHCPNGHKLNVKAFLAGKRGICPQCGCKMDIPLESQRGRDAKKQAASDAAEDVSEAAPVATAATSQAASPAVATAGAAVASAPAAPVPQTAPVVAAAPSDPIAESPQALWYVRPTTGGQYGPASGDAMRGWINEGRVNGQSLIWREGWPEWKKADGIFKQLAQPAAPVNPPVAAAPAMAVPNVAAAAPATAATTPTTAAPSVGRAVEPRPIVRRRRSNVPTIVAVVAMTVLFLFSAVVLFVIMRE